MANHSENSKAVNLSDRNVIARALRNFSEAELNALFANTVTPERPEYRPQDELRALYGKSPSEPFTLADICETLLPDISAGIIVDDVLTPTLTSLSALKEVYYNGRANPDSIGCDMLLHVAVDDFFDLMEAVNRNGRGTKVKHALHEFAESFHPEYKTLRHTPGEPLFLGDILAMARQIFSRKMWAESNLEGDSLKGYTLFFIAARSAAANILLFPYADCFTGYYSIESMAEFSKYLA